MAVDMRKYPRYSTSKEVVYYTADAAGPEKRGRIHYFGTIVDMSQGGARLVVDHPHEEDERVWLQGVHSAADVIRGRVRWVKDIQDKYNVGVEFLSNE